MSASPQALAAVKAIKNRRKWGWYATGRFLVNQGVPTLMWNIVRNVERGRA